jgi:hypothetical protein
MGAVIALAASFATQSQQLNGAPSLEELQRQLEQRRQQGHGNWTLEGKWAIEFADGTGSSYSGFVVISKSASSTKYEAVADFREIQKGEHVRETGVVRTDEAAVVIDFATATSSDASGYTADGFHLTSANGAENVLKGYNKDRAGNGGNVLLVRQEPKGETQQWIETLPSDSPPGFAWGDQWSVSVHEPGGSVWTGVIAVSDGLAAGMYRVTCTMTEEKNQQRVLEKGVATIEGERVEINFYSTSGTYTADNFHLKRPSGKGGVLTGYNTDASGQGGSVTLLRQ